MRRAVTLTLLGALCLATFGLPTPATAQDAGVAAPVDVPVAVPVVLDAGTAPGRDAGPRVRPAVRRRPRIDASRPGDAGLDAGAADAALSPALGSPPDGGPDEEAGPLEAGVGDAAVAPTAVDAATDAGPDAGPPVVEAAEAPAPAPSQDVPWTTLLNELLFERAAREQRRAVPAEPRAATPGPAPTTVVNTPRDVDVNIVGCSARPELLGLGLPERRISTFGLLLLLGLAFLTIATIDRLRRPLPERGLLPRGLGVANMAARLAVVVILLMLVSRLLPAWLRPALLLTIAAVAVTVGFGAVWVVLPDVVAGIILLTERRLRPGLYLSGDGFRGTLERVSPRVTTLRAPDGTTLTVPNRTLVKSRIQSSDRRWHELEVELTAPAGHPAPRVRRAIEDAVLSSPHIPPSPGLIVSRDPARPDRWRVKTRLIDTRFAPDFEGQLLERVEEALAVNDAPDDTAPAADEA